MSQCKQIKCELQKTVVWQFLNFHICSYLNIYIIVVMKIFFVINTYFTYIIHILKHNSKLQMLLSVLHSIILINNFNKSQQEMIVIMSRSFFQLYGDPKKVHTHAHAHTHTHTHTHTHKTD